MADFENTCPRCGNPIPAEAPGGICPTCAFDLASSRALEREGDALRPSSPGLVARGLSSPRIGWLLIGALVLMTVYVLGRMLWIEAHPRPSIKVNDKLGLAMDGAVYGIGDDYRIVRVNDIPIDTPHDLNEAYRAGDGNRFEIFFDSLSGSRRYTWIVVPYVVSFSVDVSGVVEPSDRFPDLQLQDDERVVAINGRPVSEAAATAAQEDSQISTQFSIVSDETGTSREILVQWHDSSVYWVRFLTGFVFAVLGVVAFRLRPNSRSAWGFAFFAIAIGLTWYTRSLYFYSRTGIENLVYLIAQCLFFVPCVVFILAYTSFRLVVGRPSRWIGLAFVAGLSLLVADLILGPGMATYGLLTVPLFRVWSFGLLALVLVCLSSPLWVRISGVRLRPTDRQRYGVIWLAVALSFLPGALYNVLRFSFGGPLTYALVSELVVLAFPLLVLYAILRHNLLNVNELARSGLLYGVLLGLLTLTYAGIVGVASPVVDRVFRAEQPWVQPIAFSVIFLLAIPAYTRMRKSLDARFNRIPVEYESLLDTVGSGAFHDSTPAEYCQMVVRELHNVTGARHVTILTNFEDYGGWSIAAVSPAAGTYPDVERCEDLFRLLEIRKAPIFLEDIIEEVVTEADHDSVLDALYLVDAEVVYPLVAYGKVVGALALGEKSSHRNYRASELKSLRQLTRHVSLTLVNLLGRITALKGRRIADIFPRYPDTIGKYHVRGVLGEGGMAYVYLAEQDGRKVAIKVANLAVQAHPQLMERFHREAIAIKRIDSPHVVEIYEVDWRGTEPYIVMEYFPRGSLDVLIKSGEVSDEDTALRVVLDAARGLEAGLREGIYHRDIKPRNLFVADDGTVKVGDFGLASLADHTPLTKTGDLFGTPEYLSPEAAQGESVDWRADQYALGVTLFHMLAGVAPFRGETFEAVLYQHIHETIPKITPKGGGTISRETRRILSTLLAKEPKRRYASYKELIDEIEATLLSTADSAV